LTDWLAITFDGDVDALLPGAKGLGWVETEHGGYGYKRCRVWGNVRWYYDGTEVMREHLVITGQGCRELEGAGLVTDWIEFFRRICRSGAHATRLDLAWDDREGVLDMPTIARYLESGHVTCRWRTMDIRRPGPVGEVAPIQTVYLGSSESETKVRIYDKALEQGLPYGSHWIRVELETRHKTAQTFVEVLSGQFGDGLGQAFGYLNNMLQFLEPTGDTNKSRWPVAVWWAEFIGGMAEAKLSLAPVIRTMDSVFGWLRSQVAPSLALVFAAVGGDRDAFEQTIHELVDNGRARWGPRHLALLSGI
jgi:phage replication initiation protein